MRRLRTVFLSGLFLLTSCSPRPPDVNPIPTASPEVVVQEQSPATLLPTSSPIPGPLPSSTPPMSPTDTANPEDLDDLLACYEVAVELMVDAHTAVWLGIKHWGSNPSEAGLQEIYQFLASRSERHDRFANGEETRAMNAVCADAYRTFLSTSTSIQFVNYGSGVGTNIGSLVDTAPIERWAGHYRYLLMHEYGLSSEALDAAEAPLWEEAQRLWGTPRLQLTRETQTASATPVLEPGAAIQSAGSGISFYLREGPDYTYPASAVVIDDGSIEVVGQYANCAFLKVISGELSGWIANPDGIFLAEENCVAPSASFRPFTGTFFQDGRVLVTGFQEGPGELAIENHDQDDAIAVLSRSDGEAYISFYVRGGEAFVLREIPDGVYTLFITTGREWNPDSGLFNLQPEYFQFEEQLDFDASGIRWSVELQTSEDGNTQTEDIPAEVFPH